MYLRHVSVSYCLHFSAPAIAVSVDAAGGVAITANTALCCSCLAQPFSVSAARSLVTTLQNPFRLHWCMRWSNRCACLQLNDILVLCYCSICVFMEIGTSLSGSLLRPQMQVQVWQVSLQTHDATFESHFVPTQPANTTVSRINISHAFRYLSLLMLGLLMLCTFMCTLCPFVNTSWNVFFSCFILQEVSAGSSGAQPCYLLCALS